ncbi:histone-binding protein N1/N2-like [Syngnathoides biaculeatus]|uniref:histone-binding protein N1/N2-like n=1 Tax=Syngnathoides biaculeatus TaxID=300417 RepID=UPI002ADE7979|nr:histone-binding protein N1/N2-like [Syngnathoides biaculeatus]
MEEANKLIGAGKKHLVMGRAAEAVSSLQEACGILTKAYGDTADECAEAIFWCGKALLELARMENAVVCNPLDGVPGDQEKPEDSSADNVDEKSKDDSVAEGAHEGDGKCHRTGSEPEESEADKSELRVEEEEDEELENAAGEKLKVSRGEADGKLEEPSEKMEDDKAADQMEEMEASPAGKSEKMEDAKKTEEEPSEKMEEKAEAREKDDEKMQGDEEPAVGEEQPAEGAKDGDEESAEELVDAGAKESDNDDDEDEEEEEEEVGNLQLAWEMLEVAKVIYMRKESKENQLMAAEAYLKLGEVSAESGNFHQALEDFRECLSLRLKHSDSDSRLVAEAHFQLGLTFHLNRQYEEAVDALDCAVRVVKSRLDKLREAMEKAAGRDELPEDRKEMEELEALLPDIQEKMEDAAECLKMFNRKTAPDGASGSAEQSGDAFATSPTKCSPSKVTSADAPVSDISHLVRKKRKPEESPVKEGVIKKVKQEEAQEENGVHKACGDAQML